MERIVPKWCVNESAEPATTVGDAVRERSLLLEIKPDDQDSWNVHHTDSYT